MIALRDIRYVRLGTADLDHAVDFAIRILGLELVEKAAGRAYLRADDRDHTLVYESGPADAHVLGFELAGNCTHALAAAALEQAGFGPTLASTADSAERRAHAVLRFTEPSGTTIELLERPYASGRPYVPSRDAGITSFSHVGLYSRAPARDEAFWTGLCGARVSDWIGDAALLRIDRVHHKIALFPAARSGVQHVNHQVAGIDDLMRSWYFLRERGVRILFGPGRHPTSGAMFLYFAGPDGVTYEYSTGVSMIDDERAHVPRQFPFESRSFCLWGAVPDIPEFRTGSPAGAAAP